jgi:predicted ribonuclease YlaK
MARIVYLFPDTNVLVQCRPLEQLDWSGWKNFDEVHLVLSRPVQAEIDDHKNKGRDRLAKRAKAASSKIRDLITGDDDHLVVRPTGPSVKLFLNPLLRPSQELADVLDYSRADDQLVGSVHAFTKKNEGADARVLTHDTGPMATARTVGVAIAPVPDEWLLPPEPSESDKRIRALEAEVARLSVRPKTS